VRPDFRVNDRLRLEIETPGDDTTGAQNNLVLNPDGAQGGYWWSSTPSSHVKSTTTPTLALFMDTAGGGHIATGYMPVTAGRYVAAQFTILTIQAAHNVQATIEFLDAARVALSATPAATYTTTGTQYLAPVVVPAGAAYCRIHLYYYSGASGTAAAAAGDTFTFTNVALSTGTTNTFATVRTNLVPNPSFETNTTGWGVQGSGGLGGFATAARVTSGGFSGPCFYQATYAGTRVSANTTTRIPVVKGQTYTVSAYVRSTAGRLVDLELSFFATAGPAVLSGFGSAGKTLATGAWQRLSRTMTAVDNYLSVAATASSGTIGQTVDLDAVLVEKAGTLGAYFDGTTASGGGHTFGWTGTAHASTSTDTLSAWAYLPPLQFQNILGSANAITVAREALNVGTLAATVVDPDLDPATAPTVIAVGRRCRLMALGSAGTWAPLFTGYVDQASTAYVMDKETGTTKPQITLTAHDATQELANIAQPYGVASLANLPGLFEGSGFAIGVPWNVNGNRDPINTFTSVSHNPDASVLDQVAIVRDVTRGKAWVGADGVLNVFPPSTPAAVVTYQDTGATSATVDSYSDIDVSFSTSSVINSVSVTSLKIVSTGETWSYNLGPYVDQNSIDKYGAYAASFTVHGMSDAAVATWAGQVLAANAVPVRKVNSITVPVTDSFGVDHALAVDLCSPVGVVRTGIVTGTLRVESISHSIQANADFDRWLVTYEFADPGSVAAPQLIPTQSVPTSAPTGWTDYACTVSGLTNCTATTARYAQRGDKVTVAVVVTFTGTPVASANGLEVSLPLAGFFSQGNAPVIGGVTLQDLSAAARYAGVLIAPGGGSRTTVIARALGVSGLHTTVSAGAPFAWASGDTAAFEFEYIAA
jgi:hypothetical protein